MLQVIEGGWLATVQDAGRPGYRELGVTRAGAMDLRALGAANELIGNTAGDAAVEIASPGFAVRALESCVVGVAGAGYALNANGRSVPANAALALRAGEVLELGEGGWGHYAYLAVSGGVDVPLVLGSRATDLRGGFGGMSGRALVPGDILMARASPRERAERAAHAGTVLGDEFEEYYRAARPIGLVWGPHDEWFSPAARETLLAGEFTVNELSDRMGTRLCGPDILRREGELLSCGVTRGAIQVPAGGQLIVLQADYQTTGGYPVLGTVIELDQPWLAQRRTGESVRFRDTEKTAAG